MTEAEHLAAIWAAPDDDGPRLIFADWLLERDDPRGELIQLDCRMASLAWFAPERRETAIRRAQLLSQHRAAWLGPLVDAGIGRAIFRRGFVDRITFDRPIDRLRELAPLAREAELVAHPSPDLAALVALGFDAFRLRGNQLHLLPPDVRLRGLAITGTADLPAGSFEWLELDRFTLPVLPRARRLTITSSSLLFLDLREEVEELRLEGCTLDDARIRELTARRAPNLRSVALPRNMISDEGARALVAWDAPRLVHIDLDQNRMSGAGLRALAARPGLRQLSIAGNPYALDAVPGLVVLREPAVRQAPPRFFADELDPDLRALDEDRLVRQRQQDELRRERGRAPKPPPVEEIPFELAPRPRPAVEQRSLVESLRDERTNRFLGAQRSLDQEQRGRDDPVPLMTFGILVAVVLTAVIGIATCGR